MPAKSSISARPLSMPPPTLPNRSSRDDCYFAAHRAEDQLEKLVAHYAPRGPQVPVILDTKRGDIGSTAEQYAKALAFGVTRADCVTLSPFAQAQATPVLPYP